MKSLSNVQLFATLWTITYQAPLSMGFSRQEYWSGVPLPSPVIRRGEKLLLNKLLLNIQNQLITLTFTVRNQMQWKRIIPSLYYGCVSLTFIQSMNVEKSIFYSKAYRTPFSRGSSWPRARNCVSRGSCIASRFFYHWATGEAQKVSGILTKSKVRKEWFLQDQYFQKWAIMPFSLVDMQNLFPKPLVPQAALHNCLKYYN